MATPQFGNLEQQATQRINPFLRGLSMLTGGISGELTGTNEQIRQQRSARRALLQEELQRRDDQRTLERQLMISALQSGVGELEGNTLEEKMADLQRKRIQKEIIGEQGRIYGLGQTVGPSPYESDPAFRIGALRGQREIAEKEAAAAVEEKLQRPGLEAQIRGFGGTPTAGAPTGELRGQLEKIRMETQSRIPLETRGSQAKAELSALQGLGFDLGGINIGDLTPQQAIAQAEIFNRKYQQQNYFGEFERRSKSEEKAVDDFTKLLSDPNRSKEELKASYFKLPKEARTEEYRLAAGVPRPATAKENESLDNYLTSIDKASTLAKSVSDLVGTGDFAKVSKKDFNGYSSWLRNLKNKYGSEDPRLRSINNVIQEFQSLIAGERKNFFGASLTNNEFEVAKSLFGDPNQANFLPRVLQLVDSIMSKDEIQLKFDRRGIFVDEATRSDVQNARQNWIKTREQFNFGGTGGTPRKAADNRIQQLQSEASALRQALGMTNAPSTTR
jgi:hypothetical protein